MITKLKYDEFHYTKAYIYLKVETAFLNSIVYASSDNTTSGLDKIGITANSVRPETFDMSSLTLDNIINNRYYKVTYGPAK